MSDREVMLMDLRNSEYGLDCDTRCQREAMQQATQVISAIPVSSPPSGGTVIYNITVVIGNNNPVVGDKAVELEREKIHRRGY